MKWTTCLLTMCLALGLAACGKEEAPAPETNASPAEPAAAEATAPAPEKSGSGGGGYEPAEDERVPGITMSQEDLDKELAEARANTPMPEIPEEETKAE